MRVLTTVFPASSIRGSAAYKEKGEPMKSSESKRNLHIGAAFVSILVALGACQALLENRAATPGPTVQAPMFEVDPLWPRPLPNHWLLGWTIGAWVDEQDHVWVIHRGAGGLHDNEKGLELKPPISECCRTAPPILVFDQAGNLVRSWRSEEHTSELQSLTNLVCRLLLEKKKKKKNTQTLNEKP